MLNVSRRSLAPLLVAIARGIILPAVIALSMAPGGARSAHAQGADGVRPAPITDLGTGGTVLYVDGSNPSASDTGPGTAAQPWRTLLHAVKTARAGETVLIRRGTYNDAESGRVAVANSGTPGNPITFAAYPGDERQVVINNATFRIHGQSYITVRGLKVQGVTASSSRGFSIQGPGTDITLSGCETYGTTSSGIGVWGVSFNTDPTDYQHLFNIVLENNLVRRACDGGYDECITVANGVHNIIVRNNEVTESGSTVNGGEGIDFKEGVFGGQVTGNRVHDIVRVAIYMDAAGVAIGPGGVEDIEISGNEVWNITNGGGIELGDEGRGNLKNLRVSNNVVHGVSGMGLLVYAHPSGSGTATGITLVNNTVYANRSYGVRINWPATRSSGFVARNNLGYLNAYGDYSVEAAIVSADHNLWGVDPLFVDALGGNFRLRPGSPAVDAGSATGAPAIDYAGTTRPQGAGFDIGAFELVP